MRASDTSMLSYVKSGKYRFGECFECSFQHMSYVCSVHVARNSDHKPLVQDVQRQSCQETSGPSDEAHCISDWCVNKGNF